MWALVASRHSPSQFKPLHLFLLTQSGFLVPSPIPHRLSLGAHSTNVLPSVLSICCQRNSFWLNFSQQPLVTMSLATEHQTSSSKPATSLPSFLVSMGSVADNILSRVSSSLKSRALQACIYCSTWTKLNSWELWWTLPQGNLSWGSVKVAG